jgi:hypothetical protein
MSFELPADLHPDLTSIAWMIGRWEGSGKATYPGTEDFDFGQQIDFAHNGGNYLHYLSQTFEVDDQGLAIKPLGMETGFWRPQSDGSLEVVMCHAAGYAEVWYGSISGAKIELVTDAVVRTASAEDYARQRCRRPVVDFRQGCTRPWFADTHVGPAAPGLTHNRPG